MAPIPVIAIIDIGKTNKKIFLFDENYKVVFENSVVITEITDEDNFPCEDLNSLQRFVFDSLQNILSNNLFDVKAINFCAYGASFVHISKEGKPLTQLINYLKPYPEQLKKEFYETYGGESSFAKLSASPVLGNLNSGMQLYYLKHAKPKEFNQIKYSLHLPQYISYLVADMPVSDITSIGCHTNLWDYLQNTYHQWVYQEEVFEKLAPIIGCDKTINATIHEKTLRAGGGLHDSSAALIPYLISFQKPFILISTGTWCISLNPFNSYPLTDDELKNDCLNYLSYTGKPIKASRIFAGNEHEEQVKRISKNFNRNINDYTEVKYDPAIVKNLKLLSNKAEDQINSFESESFFQHRKLKYFISFEEAYHQLMLDIVDQQFASTTLILKNTGVTQIYVDGGFSKNEIYMKLLAGAFSGLQVFAASMAHGTALGAAFAIHTSWNKNPLPKNIIELKRYASY